MSSSDYTNATFSFYDYSTYSSCTLKSDFDSDGALQGFEIREYSDYSYCDYEDGSYISVTLGSSGNITSMTLPDGQEVTMYQYEELYGDNGYYQSFFYEVYLVPESEVIPVDDDEFYYEGDYISVYTSDSTLETFDVSSSIDGVWSWCEMVLDYPEGNEDEQVLMLAEDS